MKNDLDGENIIRTALMTSVVIILELIRVLIIMAIVVGILGYFGEVYVKIGTDIDRYSWMTYIAFPILIFVLYRNKLQFSGWNKGKGIEILPKLVSQILIFTSISQLFLPPVLSFFYS
ncbi:hypothetical protein OR571_16685 [Psychrobacillus sp. NEAU-3TGS]|uniref:hypothetical protein n=1 Tax=Psychrobacillus sp. NEAU-3TGS TaxID=2995412 RepID=UPI002498F28B|nr:hypothetical protein [Psychrobacillus sp. NEAU-3TGS]MDI2588694.1 hypothetical protein [Psychrobacillus sp. NEAU-3TGS]